LRDDGLGARRAVIVAYLAEATVSCQDIRVGDEINSIMVMGKNLDYDGLDLTELLSEEFEVKLHRDVSFIAVATQPLCSLRMIA
jgi:hypothetical protein